MSACPKVVSLQFPYKSDVKILFGKIRFRSAFKLSTSQDSLLIRNYDEAVDIVLSVKVMTIYTISIILLKYVCLSVLANCRS